MLYVWVIYVFTLFEHSAVRVIMKERMGMTRSMGIRQQHMKRRRAHTIAPGFINLYDVHEDGKDFQFEGWEMWLRDVCDDYERAPIFPARTANTFRNGVDYAGNVRKPMTMVVERHGIEVEFELSETGLRPGGVWMPRSLFNHAFSIRFGANINPDHPYYYHPAQNFFQSQVRRGRLFTPHTIDSAKHGIMPVMEEMFSMHRRKANGSAPLTTGLYMIEPDVLDQINRSHIWDLFLKRRREFDHKALVPPQSRRMWEWRNLLTELNHFPVFDRETIARFTAHPDNWGDEAATDRSIDRHMSRWMDAGKVERVRFGLYRTREQNYVDYKPFGDQYLVDWFWEFLRRQAGHQHFVPTQTFTFESMLEEVKKFHPDWHAYHFNLPTNLQTIRNRLNAETKGLGDGKGTLIEKVTAKTRRLSPEGMDIFCPASVPNPYEKPKRVFEYDPNDGA